MSRPVFDVSIGQRFLWLWTHGWRRKAGKWVKSYGQVTYNLEDLEAVRMERLHAELLKEGA